MDLEKILAPIAGNLPAAWGDDVRVAVALAGVAFAILLVTLILARILGHRAPESVQPETTAQALAPGKPAAEAKARSVGPDLDPEEWVSGNVIHFDRQRSVGLIRCDLVKGPVRFQAAGFKRAPRVGEKVRFKGRHGARRKPVAVIVERAS